MPVGVNNPYLKKPKSSNASSSSSRTPTPNNNNASSSFSAAAARTAVSTAPAPVAAASTFSQSFASVEDSAYFQKEIRQNLNQKDAEARAEQRKFDNEAAAEASTSATGSGQKSDSAATAAATVGLSDRDHHVLLQPHVLYVSTKQRGNGVLNFIRNVPVAYSPMVPDYIMSSTRCALFLSCKYHALYPRYLQRRIAELQSDFVLRILLVLVDVEDNANTLRQLNKIAVLNNLTMMCCWSEEEAARYLETIKAFDGKDASLIQKKDSTNFIDQVSDFLTTCKGVNKTDAGQLVTQFGNMRAVAVASMDELGLVPGMGEVKCKRIHDAFHKPFSTRAAAARKRRKEEEQQQKEEEEEEAMELEHQQQLLKPDGEENGLECEEDETGDDREEEFVGGDNTTTKSDKALPKNGKENNDDTG